MMRFALSCMLLCACPAVQPRVHDRHAEPQVDDAAMRIRVAQLEAQHGGGLDGLVELATHGDPHARTLALRGLGRVGGPRALAWIRTALADPDLDIVAAAAGALGLAASLDEPSSADVQPLVTAYARAHAHPTVLPVILEALGRVAPGPISVITDALAVDSTARDAALACGRLGRRKLAIDDATRAALATRSAHPDRGLRYAATYALAREIVDAKAPSERAIAALLARVDDRDPEIRATAITGLAKHSAVARIPLTALQDRDWRVAVEAIRAFTGEHGSDDLRDSVAAALLRRFTELQRGTATEAQVVIEGLHALMKYAERPLVQALYIALERRVSELPDTISRAWIKCLYLEGLAHATKSLDTMAACKLPDPLRLPLIAQSEVGTLAERRELRAQLLSHADVRVRSAALAMVKALWKDSDDADRRAGIATVANALASPDPVFAGAAIEAAPDLYDLATGDERTVLVEALVARATRESDPELGAALLEVIADKKLRAGIAACRAALAMHPVLAKSGAKCLSSLGETAPAAPSAALPLPPVDVATVIGKRFAWQLTTTRGAIAIELHAEAAPWAVATIVALTRKRFYDGLDVHRVVPNFVAQGGDPTNTGSGGPGFAIPAEPSTGPGFTIGGVGMADAGRDSGGSQFFAMHSYAPHLDGRYTWVGVVTAGQDVVDTIALGDRVLHAVIVELPTRHLEATSSER